MRLLVQRVQRASAEVNSCVESRIGPGLLLTISLTVGDSETVAQQLAGKVLGLNLWPELLDTDVPWKTNVVDNGYEILVMLQTSLSATFPKSVPVEDKALSLDAARPIVEAFMAKLRAGYQEEMVALAPIEEKKLRLETVCEGASCFVLGAGDSKGAGKGGGKAADQVPFKPPPLKPELGSVTKALKDVRYLAKNKAKLESERVFQAMGMKPFQAELADATQEQSDEFAGALDAAGRAFTQKQRDKITEWTGLPFSDDFDEAEDEDDAVKKEPQDDMADDELERQMAELRGEVTDRGKGIDASKKRRLGGLQPKEEEKEDGEGQSKTVHIRPDWTGRAAPETPAAAAARQWAANRHNKAQAPWQQGGGKGLKGKGGKGRGRQPYRSQGIASLDVAHGLHHTSSGGFHFAQSTQYSDKKLHLSKLPGEGGDEEQRAAKRPQNSKTLMLMKGTPTVAPMCPAVDDGGDDDDEI